MLKLFVEHLSQLYGSNIVGYNVHNLIHLADDAKNHGPLDSISAFPFENFMSSLLKKVRKPSMPLEQVVRRWFEVTRNNKQKACVTGTTPTVCKPYHSGYVPPQVLFCSQFTELEMNGFTINLNPRNNCVTIHNDLVLVCNILTIDSTVFIVCQRFCNKNSFFEYPVHSDFLRIFKVWN